MAVLDPIIESTAHLTAVEILQVAHRGRIGSQAAPDDDLRRPVPQARSEKIPGRTGWLSETGAPPPLPSPSHFPNGAFPLTGPKKEFQAAAEHASH